ncbi:hypothetical protein BDV34DRAFT_219134 [Aspergillus parasiticus]|uniref:Uncharacterized protein n=1 Tax=Aspergillus parasiticus TaxID=5067 RepID=A0A5N6E3W0_ASPPA|nr:hypothetical protein BDV34DRAFT_219134 [Aspergillus parasiticus]
MRLLWSLAWLALAVSANTLRPSKKPLRHTQKRKHGIRKRTAASYQADNATRGGTHGGDEHGSDEDFQQREAWQQYSTGMAHLSGSTTMYIISRKSVYATHWWENVSFNPDPIWWNPADQTDDEYSKP